MRIPKSQWNICRKCGSQVIFAKIVGAGYQGFAFDTKQVSGGGYEIEDSEEAEGIYIGELQARYIRIEDRLPRTYRYRRHLCPGKPEQERNDN